MVGLVDIVGKGAKAAVTSIPKLVDDLFIGPAVNFGVNEFPPKLKRGIRKVLRDPLTDGLKNPDSKTRWALDYVAIPAAVGVLAAIDKFAGNDVSIQKPVFDWYKNNKALGIGLTVGAYLAATVPWVRNAIAGGFNAVRAYTVAHPGRVLVGASAATFVAAATVLGMNLASGPKQGPAGVAGEKGAAGENYVPTDADLKNIAALVTPVPGEPGSQGPEGPAGADAVVDYAKLQLDYGKIPVDPSKIAGSVEQAVKDYINKNPQLFAIPTPTPAAGPTPAPTPTHAPAATPGPTVVPTVVSPMADYFNTLLSRAGQGQEVGIAFYRGESCFKAAPFSYKIKDGKVTDQKSRTFTFNQGRTLDDLASAFGVDPNRVPVIPIVPGKTCDLNDVFSKASLVIVKDQFTNAVTGNAGKIAGIVTSEGRYGR